jgi:hypothetical protein
VAHVFAESNAQCPAKQPGWIPPSASFDENTAPENMAPIPLPAHAGASSSSAQFVAADSLPHPHTLPHPPNNTMSVRLTDFVNQQPEVLAGTLAPSQFYAQ